MNDKELTYEDLIEELYADKDSYETGF